MEYTIQHIRTLNSTNSYAKELLNKGKAEEGLVIMTDYQDNGRGQGENSWISNKEKNLLMSWVLRPAFLTVSSQFMLSKAVTLGISDAIKELDIDVRIKWPNDIIFENKKLGGILIENSIQGEKLKNSIIGFGLNVNQEEFPSFPFPATSLKNVSGRTIPVQELTRLIMTHLIERYIQLKRGMNDSLNAAYLDKLFRRDVPGVFEAGGQQFEGKIIGVNKYGELILDISGKTRNFGFHSIRMIP